MKKNPGTEGRVLARVFADDLKKVVGADVKKVKTDYAGGDVEVVTDPTGALADHEV